MVCYCLRLFFSRVNDYGNTIAAYFFDLSSYPPNQMRTGADTFHQQKPGSKESGYICNVRPPATIADLVNITPTTMVYGTYNYSYWGKSKPANITGGPHIVAIIISVYTMSCRYEPVTQKYQKLNFIGWPTSARKAGPNMQIKKKQNSETCGRDQHQNPKNSNYR